MTLDEMLALLPDNSVGAITAADLRVIVTALYTETEAVAVGKDSNTEAIRSLTSDVAALGSRVGQVEILTTATAGNVDALAARVEQVETVANATAGNVDWLAGRVNEIDARVTALEQAG